jgi:HlyD family secretion protein
MKKWIAFIVLAIGAQAVYWASAQGAARVPAKNVELRDLVAVEGELRATHSVELGPPNLRDFWNYKISMVVSDGSMVKSGQPVLAFDTQQLVQQLEQEQSRLESTIQELEKRTAELAAEVARQELALAEAQARRRKFDFELDVPEEVVARNELERARIEHGLATREIAYSEAQLQNLAHRRQLELGNLRAHRDLAASRVHELQRGIEEMTLRAPSAGTAILIANFQGEKPKVGDQIWRAAKVVQIPDLTRFHVEADVEEASAGRLALGQKAHLRLDSLPDLELVGTIAKIGKSVLRHPTQEMRRIVRVEISLAEVDPAQFRPGMRLRGEIEVGRRSAVLTLPETAISFDAAGAYVETPRFGPFGRRRVAVELGQRSGGQIEVKAGLVAGQEILAKELDAAAGHGASR